MVMVSLVTIVAVDVDVAVGMEMWPPAFKIVHEGEILAEKISSLIMNNDND